MRHTLDILPRRFEPPEGSFFLFGPRGTGKSTWVRQAFPDAVYVDLLDPAELRAYLARPERLAERVRAEPDGRVVVVDEVQKAPALLSVVHQLLEEKRGWRFVLTGSSARKLKRAGVDLLAGRAALRTMHPFMAVELADRFDLDGALSRGLLPVVVDSADPAEALAAYAGLYVREEVQAEGLVRRVGDFSRFLEAIAFSQAAPLNISDVARDCEVGRKTVESYVEILEDLLLSFRLPVFSRRARRATVARPRFFFADVGVYRSLRAAGPLDRSEEVEGPALEGLVAQHLRAWNEYGGTRHQLYYWRTRGGSEVDLVVYGPFGLFAIEVKRASRIRPADLKGLRAFRDDYPEATPLLLHGGTEPFEVAGIACVPVARFLRDLVPGQTLWRR